VLELLQTKLRVVRCLGPASVLDSLDPGTSTTCRVAADELLLLGWDGNLPTLGHGLALDHSDAFAAFAFKGDRADEAFSRLSEVELPDERPAFVQGAVATVPAKVVVEENRILVLVSSSLGHHLRERALESCADLELVEGNA